jgi:hypothetical protein
MSTATDAALAGLAASRQRLGAAMNGSSGPRPRNGGRPGRRAGRLFAPLLAQMLGGGAPSLPGTALSAIRAYPWPAVLAAAAGGAAVVFTRPWRWAVWAEPWALLRQQASRWAVGQFVQLPTQAALAALLASLTEALQATPATATEQGDRT